MTALSQRTQSATRLRSNRSLRGLRELHAAEELLPLTYDELLDVARIRSHRLPEESALDATSLLHEAFVRVAATGRQFESVPQFFFCISAAIDEVLLDERYRAGALEAGGMRHRLDPECMQRAAGPADPGEEILMVDEAILKLKRHDPLHARVVVLRFFNGLTAEETASVLGVSLATVERKWRRLKAWLRRELT